MLYTIGQRVNGPHGLGTVVALNNQQTNQYFDEHPLVAATIAAEVGLPELLIRSMYDAERYPYVVMFDSGYQDVYGETELEAV